MKLVFYDVFYIELCLYVGLEYVHVSGVSADPPKLELHVIVSSPMVILGPELDSSEHRVISLVPLKVNLKTNILTLS